MPWAGVGAGSAGTGTVSWIGAGMATGTVTGGVAVVGGARVAGMVGAGTMGAGVAGGVEVVDSGAGVAAIATGADVGAGLGSGVGAGFAVAVALARVLASATTEDSWGVVTPGSGAGTLSATNATGASCTGLGIDGVPAAEGVWARPWR